MCDIQVLPQGHTHSPIQSHTHNAINVFARAEQPTTLASVTILPGTIVLTFLPGFKEGTNKIT